MKVTLKSTKDTWIVKVRRTQYFFTNSDEAFRFIAVCNNTSKIN